jgi:hypothetical protein
MKLYTVYKNETRCLAPRFPQSQIIANASDLVSPFGNPFSLKLSFLNKVPSQAYENFTIRNESSIEKQQSRLMYVNRTPQNFTTAYPSCLPSAKRRLFCSESEEVPQVDLQMSNSIENQPAVEKVSTWLSDKQLLHDQDDDQSTVSSMPEEEKCGFKLPQWLTTESAPRLVRAQRNFFGCKLTEEERMAVARDNHRIVQQWLHDGEVKRMVGNGHVDVAHQAIRTTAQHCKFAKQAEEVIESINPAKRYPLEKYINELKGKEEEAITTAKIFRDRWEESEKDRDQDRAVAKRNNLSICTFWRRNIAEQCTRGGKILSLAMQQKHK